MGSNLPEPEEEIQVKTVGSIILFTYCKLSALDRASVLAILNRVLS
jgi:hypothetical protein